MKLHFGISLYDVNIDLSETIKDIEEMAKLKNVGVKWVDTYSFSKKHKNFGFINLDNEEKVNKENGIDLLLFNLSSIASKVFLPSYKDYCNTYLLPERKFLSYHFTKTEKSKEEIPMYDDTSKEAPKSVSLKYFVNDNYEGGEFLFPYYGINFKPRAGQLLIYPSNFMFYYIEKPVKSGTKYQFVTWN